MFSWLRKNKGDQQATFRLEGMHCQRCVERVTAALQQVPGAAVQQVDVGSATVAWDSSRTSEQALTAALAEAGYPAQREAGP